MKNSKRKEMIGMHSEKKQNSSGKVRKYLAVFLASLIFLAFFSALSQKPWAGFTIRNQQGTVAYTENPWVLQQEERVIEQQLKLPQYRMLEKGKHYSLKTRMTYDGTQDTMPYGFLHVDHLYCRILLDGQVLFSCMPEDVHRWDMAKSPGFLYKAFPLPADCQGKELEVQLLPPFDTAVEYGLPELAFGDLTSSLHGAFFRDMPHDVIVVLCVMLGFLTIIFSTVALQGSEYREGMSIGCFSLVFSLYLLTECQANAYYMGNPYYLYLLNYSAFSLLPISLMSFMMERLPRKFRTLCNWVITGELLFFAVEMILHFSGVLDLREVIPAVHIMYFLDMLLVVVLIQTMQDKKRRHTLVCQIMPVLIGMLADVVIYWEHWDVGGNDATFTILGVIFFLVIELVRVWQSGISMYTESVRTDLYRQMAYVDELTRAGNRRAYDQEIEQVASREKTFESMIVVSADVNRLKYTNDHFGHAAGDQLIQSAAQVIMDAVGNSGKVFRTGGDEFSAFLYDVPISQYEEMVHATDEKIKVFNAGSEFPLSLAIGHVQIWNNRILEAVQEADRKMYAHKARQKMCRDQEDPEEPVCCSDR